MSTAILALVALAPAFAQNPADWEFLPGAVLAPDPSIPWASRSISSPTVVYDSIRGQYLMFFESLSTDSDAHCPNGIWYIGVATSPDGVDWTIDPTPLVSPSPRGTGRAAFYNCVAAHPSAYFAPVNWGQSHGYVHVYFKAEQIDNPCQGTNKIWGCSIYSGIGLVTVAFDTNGDWYRASLINRPVVYNPNGANMGSPKIVYQNNAWRMALGMYPDIYSATGTYRDMTLNPTPILQRSVLRQTVPWVVNEVFNPTQVCDDDSAGNMDLAMFVGGRETQGAATVAGSWGKAISDRSVLSYVLDTTPQVSWTGNDDWRHWDVRKLTNADGEYVVYYDQRVGGHNEVFMGTTDPSLTWNDADFGGWRCPH